MPGNQWMIYGANGYTGTLLVDEAVRRGSRPIVAGRNEAALRPIAEKYGLELRVFSLDDAAAVDRGLQGVGTLMLAAGPFSATSKPAVLGCLRNKTHYLDITGEVGVFEACKRRGAEAQAAGVVVMPGTGFDVVPSDCLAALLHRELPSATHLTLAFRGVGAPSPGTMKTMLQGLPLGGVARIDGKLTPVPAAWKFEAIPFSMGKRTAMTIPWGDVSTAHFTTGIPNIEVFMAQPPAMIRAAKLSRYFGKLLGLAPVQSMLAKRIERTVKGPTEQMRQTGKSYLWGKVTDNAGKTVEATLDTLEGYHLTMKTGVDIALRVQAGEVKPGYQTPAKALGADYVLKFEPTTFKITRHD